MSKLIKIVYTFSISIKYIEISGHFMKNREIKLEKFERKYYYKAGVDLDINDNKPKAKLTQKGIDLVSQYYSYKYQMPPLIKTFSGDELIEKIKSEEFSNIRNSPDDVRISLIMTGCHSIPVVYIKQGGKEYLLILDSLGYTGIEQTVAEALPDITCYAMPPKAIRQRDFYSCHSEAQVILRELTGKDETGNFLIPDILNKIEKHEIKVNKQAEFPNNLHVIKLFDSLLMTVQNPAFKEAHEEEFKSKEAIRRYKGGHENIQKFFDKYPAEEMSNSARKPNVSSYSREKGLKFTQIIEIQFYLNQLQSNLGNKFTKEIKDDFISAAKKEVKQYGKIASLSEKQNNALYDLAQKTLSENLGIDITMRMHHRYD